MLFFHSLCNLKQVKCNLSNVQYQTGGSKDLIWDQMSHLWELWLYAQRYCHLVVGVNVLRIGFSLTPLGLKRHTQDIGHVQSIQPNIPIQFLQVLWSMLREYPCLSTCIEPPRKYIRHWISVLTQTWWSPTFGWMKASLITTNILFQRIYRLLCTLLK